MAGSKFLDVLFSAGLKKITGTAAV